MTVASRIYPNVRGRASPVRPSRALGGNIGVVDVVRGVDAKTAARERLPERALVSTRVAVGVCLDDGVASSEDC